jgi:hypothetical protein
MTATCVLWVRACLNCEQLFSFPESFCVDTRQCLWSSEQSIDVNTCDIGEDMGHTMTEVKITFPVSYNTPVKSKDNVTERVALVQMIMLPMCPPP